jgi:glutamate N-acetyltransferase/amino-acid N-acetyltransferase
VLHCKAEQVLVSSTGVIGVPLPVEKILNTLPAMGTSLASRPEDYTAVTRAIMTTDTRPKWAAAKCRIGGETVRLIGCAKGAGMIHPNMATMLAYILTDAAISAGELKRSLHRVVARTFNCISVDGDTSTNDTAAVFANGASGAPVIRRGSTAARSFESALEKVCRALALEIVRDGEGAQRVVEIEVRGAANERAARVIAETIATSPLVKTALAGADPNWGRILAAAGRAPLGKREQFDPDRAEIFLAGIRMYRRGVAADFDERAAHEKLLASHIPIVVELRGGRGTARMWTCDFTHDYVTINASYRT